MTGTDAWPSEIRRVVIVAFRFPEASGGAVVVGSYARMFEGAGLDVEVISLYPGTRTSQPEPTVVLRREGLQRRPVIAGRRGWRRLVRLPLVAFKRADRVQALRRYRRRMESYGPETMVVFTHVVPLTVLLESGVVWRRERPVLVGQHHSAFSSLDDEPRLRDQMRRDLVGLDGFVALSTQDAQQFARLLDLTCYAVPNPTSLEGCDASVARAARAPALAVAIARYSPEKQLDLLVRAFADATSHDPLRHWRLELYGWGPEEQALRREIVRVGASDRVRLMGEVVDVRPVLAGASCNLLSSRSEGFGLTILEAAQCGVPSLAFACSAGLTELLENVHGIAVPPSGGERAFAAALREALSSPHALAERGRRARVGAAAYAPEAVLGTWAGIARSLLSERASRVPH